MTDGNEKRDVRWALEDGDWRRGYKLWPLMRIVLDKHIPRRLPP